MIDPLADDDQALRALGQRAREQVHTRPQAWEAVALGERSEDEIAAERLAAGDAPEAVALARELFRPPSEAEHEAMVAALLARQLTGGAASSEAAAAPSQAAVVASPTEVAANDPGRPWWAAAVAIAAALVLAWWLVPGRSDSVEPEPPVLARASLPAYTLETDGGLTATRSVPSAPTAELRYRAGSTIEWIVRPQLAAEDRVGVRLFAFGEDRTLQPPAEGLVDVGPTGSVRVAGPIDALGLTPGAWTIAIVVGWPSALPSDPAAVRDAQDSETWIVRRVRLVLED